MYYNDNTKKKMKITTFRQLLKFTVIIVIYYYSHVLVNINLITGQLLDKKII